MRWTAIGAIALCVCLATAPAAAEFAALTVSAAPVALYPDNPAQLKLDRLVYRGGLVLTSPNKDFGGWSDLSVTPDGGHVTAISDNGFWFDADLAYDPDNRLTGLGSARFGELPSTSERFRITRTEFSDAEGMSIAADGSIYVSFERRHRIYLYPPTKPPFQSPARRLDAPALLQKAPLNGGIEALLSLADGRLMMLVEDMIGAEHIGWIGGEGKWGELRYRAGVEFKPTGLAQFPAGTFAAGDVLALERRFRLLGGGFSARLVRLKAADLKPDVRLEGEEIALLRGPMTVDNFEGVSIARGPNGAARIYLISDDNYMFLQQTLLLMFELPADTPATK